MCFGCLCVGSYVLCLLVRVIVICVRVCVREVVCVLRSLSYARDVRCVDCVRSCLFSMSHGVCPSK